MFQKVQRREPGAAKGAPTADGGDRAAQWVSLGEGRRCCYYYQKLCLCLFSMARLCLRGGGATTRTQTHTHTDT